MSKIPWQDGDMECKLDSLINIALIFAQLSLRARWKIRTIFRKERFTDFFFLRTDTFDEVKKEHKCDVSVQCLNLDSLHYTTTRVSCWCLNCGLLLALLSATGSSLVSPRRNPEFQKPSLLFALIWESLKGISASESPRRRERWLENWNSLPSSKPLPPNTYSQVLSPLNFLGILLPLSISMFLGP